MCFTILSRLDCLPTDSRPGHRTDELVIQGVSAHVTLQPALHFDILRVFNRRSVRDIVFGQFYEVVFVDAVVVVAGKQMHPHLT